MSDAALRWLIAQEAAKQQRAEETSGRLLVRKAEDELTVRLDESDYDRPRLGALLRLADQRSHHSAERAAQQRLKRTHRRIESGSFRDRRFPPDNLRGQRRLRRPSPVDRRLRRPRPPRHLSRLSWRYPPSRSIASAASRICSSASARRGRPRPRPRGGGVFVVMMLGHQCRKSLSTDKSICVRFPRNCAVSDRIHPENQIVCPLAGG